MGNILYKKESIQSNKISYESLYTVTCNTCDVGHIIGLVHQHGARVVGQTSISDDTTCLLINGSEDILSINIPSNGSICVASPIQKQ